VTRGGGGSGRAAAFVGSQAVEEGGGWDSPCAGCARWHDASAVGREGSLVSQSV